MIKVLVVEDSAVVREFLLHILRRDQEFEVVGTAEDGEQALAAVERTRPDVITMDIHMPRMNGFDATRRIMETRPTPIVIVSGTADAIETARAFRAMEAGAVAVLERPAGIGHPDYERTAAELIQTLRLMTQVKVVRRWPRSAPSTLPAPACTEPPRRGEGPVVVAIGASTGGPPVLQSILSQLPQNFPASILVVQHIALGFTEGFAKWLSDSSTLSVHVAVEGERILPGHVYVAPDGLHMKVGRGAQICLSKEEPENGLRPSVSVLFRSVAEFYGRRAVGVLLTGMGKDGAQELKLMMEKGSVTIAQDRESSAVHGMPGEAIRLGAASFILTPEKISLVLTSLVGEGCGVHWT